MHNWGVSLSPDLGFQSCGAGGHWGVIGVGAGHLGGFDPDTLTDNGDGTFTVAYFQTIASSFSFGTGPFAYNQLELYLMGLLGPSDVEPMIRPVGLDCSSLSCSFETDTCTFAAEGIQTITIEDIISAHGVRTPSSAASQRSFATAYVITSQTLLTGAEMAYYNAFSKAIQDGGGDGVYTSFADTTLGLAEMETVTPYVNDLDIFLLDGFEADSGFLPRPPP